jgi:D-tyrosyl-tRNA(Tyr) deacylase
LLVYLGVGRDDGQPDLDYMADKITHLRIFTDAEGKMNLSLEDIEGGVLLISAFALQADARKGRRPSFDPAAEPQMANDLYERLAGMLRETGLAVEQGVFRAHMDVASVNDGPVTILLDSKKMF